MRILIVNPPHPAIGSRIPHEHLPPLGLLAIGGPLLDDGHTVQLLDAEFGPMSIDEIVQRIHAYDPDAVLLGHSGSTSIHPVIVELTRAIRQVLPYVWIIYGGVFPTYHWREILEYEPQIDVIVRGEGEETTLRLMRAIEQQESRHEIPGLALRKDGLAFSTPSAPLIHNLDDYRVGWELVDLDRYSYWGAKKAVVIQLSRGCPHNCSYCGQRGFWKRWRYRDPRRVAAEIAWLHRVHGVEVFNFADENPTSSREVWLTFLEAMIAENVDVILVGSTRADDIVRDADILHLYKKAGVARWLLGIENYDEEALKRIHKGGSVIKDRQAIQLLRQHDILSLATWVVGFEEETDRNCLHGLRQLLSYDPDQIQLIYATPHRWTPYYRAEAKRRIIQTDIRRWDYKHQVLSTKYMPPWRVLLWAKAVEVIMQMRPRALWRVLAHRDRSIRAAQRWYYRIGRKVWFYEVWCFLFRDQRVQNGPTLVEFWGAPQDTVEEAMSVESPPRQVEQLVESG
jgi:anaerobic magnesium-protoporphyrin IX monomethyl ester cyclase